MMEDATHADHACAAPTRIGRTTEEAQRMTQLPRHSGSSSGTGAHGGPDPYGGPSFVPNLPYGGEVVLFDPSNDTSPYAVKHKKKKDRATKAKPSAKASARAKAAARVYEQHDPYDDALGDISLADGLPRGASPTVGRPFENYPVPTAVTPPPARGRSLRIVTDDPSEIRRYAEAQSRSEASRTRAGSPPAAAPHGPQEGGAPASASAFPPDPARGRNVGAPSRTAPAQPQQPTNAPAPAHAAEPVASEPGTPTWSSYEIDDDLDHPRPSARRRGAPHAASEPIVFANQTAPRQPAAEAAPNTGTPSSNATDESENENDGKPRARRRHARTPRSDQAGEGATHKSPDKHRRSVRKKSAAKPARAVRRRLDSETFWRRSLVSVTAAAALCATIAMLYLPAQQLYLNMRENERLVDELDQNLARNEQIQQRVDALQTAEGVQDEARRVYGLIIPGDNAVSIVGVDYEESSTTIPAEIPRGSGQNTNTWATDLLDRVFGVTSLGTSTAEATDVATVTEQSAEEDETEETDVDADIVAQGDEAASS